WVGWWRRNYVPPSPTTMSVSIWWPAPANPTENSGPVPLRVRARRPKSGGPDLGACLVRRRYLLDHGQVEAVAAFGELRGLVGHPPFDGLHGLQPVLLRVLAYVVGDLHGAELRPAHGAEVGGLGRFRGQGLVMEGLCGLRVQGQVELVLPTELETCLGQFVVPLLCPGVTLGDVRGVRGQF